MMMRWYCGFNARCLLYIKMSVCFYSLTHCCVRSVPHCHLWIYVYECVLFAVQCRIPVTIRTEAVCTSAGPMAAKRIAIAKVATSWQMTRKPVKVNQSQWNGKTVYSC